MFHPCVSWATSVKLITYPTLHSYGVRGFEVIYRTLNVMFLNKDVISHTTNLAYPLSPDYLMRKVLVPKTAVGLIAEDLDTVHTNPNVLQILQDSRAYGSVMFPDDDSFY